MIENVRIASLFSGIGGFEKGILQADPSTEIVFASEIDKYARQIYKKNFGVEPHGDITQIDAADIPNHDILCGGFPCQSFSIAGKRRGFEDIRGTLFFEIMRIAKSKRPELLFLENVRGIFSHDEGRTFQTILRSLDDVGYDAEWQVFNSKNHGVPQNRERVFIIGHIRGGSTRPIFPITCITESVQKTCDGNCICTGTLSTRNQSGQAQWDGSTTLIRVNNPTHSNDRVYNPEAASPTLNASEGGNRQPLIICDSGQGRKDQHRSGIVPPLRANTGAGYNNLVAGQLKSDLSIRRLTPVECERLQGFPDGWTEGISDTQRYKCLGNAVTVNVIEFIYRHILRSIR